MRKGKHIACINRKPTPEYGIYMQAKQRCTNPNNIAYTNYGGRGIEFRLRSFDEMIDTIGLRPTPKHTLDRIDVNGHYEVWNIRWATRSMQNINKRMMSNNTSGYRGVSWHKPLSKWRARICVDGKQITILLSDSIIECALAYNNAALHHFGTEAKLNVIPPELPVAERIVNPIGYRHQR
jgi:hypothetical protein